MAKSIGSRPDAMAGLGSVTRPLRKKAAGIYPSKGTGLGQYGSSAFPTVVEQYNRTTDHKRWILGQAYYFGAGRTWADYQIHSLARFVTGAVDGTSKEVTTLFPSSTSPERAWYASCRTRGSIILPQPLQAAAITLNTSSANPADHTLTLNVSGVLTPAQVGVFSIFIGDQFEDSASSASYPAGLVERDVGSVALTLIAANPGSLTLVFDLSRPAGRVERNGHIYWQTLPYDPSAPTTWRASGTRHLCSSFKFFCCCPDHLGGAVANLESPRDGHDHNQFPLPNAARDVNSPWESQGAGYYRQWRTLPRRRDQRRDCKHIHALRWECGVPWLEPDDYPVGDERELLELAVEREKSFTVDEIMDYMRLRQVNWDRFALSVADVVGIILFPDGDPREVIRPDARPMLWNDSEQPLAIWCRQNDWWLERGTQRLQIFNGGTGRFEPTVTVGGSSFPMLQIVEPGTPGAPVIVP